MTHSDYQAHYQADYMADYQNVAEQFQDQGFCFPLTIFSEDEANAYRQKFESLEPQIAGTKLGNKAQLNYVHVIFPFVYEIATNKNLLDAVESILGPDILIWGSTFFLKEPYTPSYVSWHQDLRYWGLDGDSLVSAWLALSPAKISNGCMRFVPHSHKNQLLEHKDTFSEDNFLTRGQEADIEIDESDTVHVELDPGQASFHHGHLLHASAPNLSDQRRIGLVMNFIAPHMRQVVAAKDFVMLVRGEDKFGHFEHVSPPTENLSEQSLSLHSHILRTQNEALYDGVAKPN